jgi:hypothetical protein
MEHLLSIFGILALLIASGVAGQDISRSDFSAALAAVDWTQLNASSLALIPSSEFSAITKEALSSIPDAVRHSRNEKFTFLFGFGEIFSPGRIFSHSHRSRILSISLLLEFVRTHVTART